jgi:fido (protein-threonine AMPylation protein)
MTDEWKPRCPEWITEDNSPLAQEQRRLVLKKLVEKDYSKIPSEELVKAWHKEMFDGVAPCNDYVGQFRDQERTSYCLQDYEVMVGGVSGTHSSRVLLEVDDYFKEFNAKLNQLESSFPKDDKNPPVLSEVSKVVELTAWAHGEWVRIHPFANGNGRTARLLANYVLVHFGFGPAFTLKPRPDQPYGTAARASMQFGYHKPMEEVIWRLLAKSYG